MLSGDAQAFSNIESGMAYADGQGAIGVTICGEPFPLDFDYEVEEAGGDLIGYAGSYGGVEESLWECGRLRSRLSTRSRAD
jgi:hypothetical protein